MSRTRIGNLERDLLDAAVASVASVVQDGKGSRTTKVDMSRLGRAMVLYARALPKRAIAIRIARARRMSP